MVRKNNQIPTKCVFLAKTSEIKKGKGAEAIDIYNQTGRTAQEWQVRLINQICSRNKAELWVHTKFGYSVPRRNGKSEIIVIRELWGILNGEQILHTAHRTTTSHDTWTRLCTLLNALGYKSSNDVRKNDGTPEEMIYDQYKAFGLEQISIRSTGGKINFRTRTSKGGLGEGYDLLVIDEAQEYQDDQESALKYVVTSSKNPQTLLCGTPPTTVSSGTVFLNLRKRILETGAKNSGWAEWSVEEVSDVYDSKLWKKTNPSLGVILTERSIEDEITDDALDFNIQRLGLWVKYSQQSAISERDWAGSKIDFIEPTMLKGKLFVGIKFGIDGKSAALSIAVKTVEDNIFIQCLQCKPIVQGFQWIIDILGRLDYQEVYCDGKSGQSILEEMMKEARLKHLSFPTVKEVIEANAKFEQAIYFKTILHTPQQSVDQLISNTKKRNIGSKGGFGYSSSCDDFDIAILDSIIFAFFACEKAKERKPQRVGY